MSPAAYRVRDQFGPYFVTITVKDWVDVFTRNAYVEIVLNSIRHCIFAKGLELNAWVVMTNHFHFVGRAAGHEGMSAIIRDFKHYTAREVLEAIVRTPESRREWMMDRFVHPSGEGARRPNFQFWKPGYHAVSLENIPAMQKVNYIHQNPVKAGIVSESHHYQYSSAIDYCGGTGLLPVVVL